MTQTSTGSRYAILAAMAVSLAGTLAQGQEIAPGTWSLRAPLLEANSEFALAEANGLLYVLGGYPQGRVSVTTVQIYDPATDVWRLGPPLPQPNNHGMAAAVDGVVYLIGGQTDPNVAYVDTVYALDPDVGVWVEKAPMPTARSAGVAVVLDGKIYVAGGRPPHGSDFAVYDPATDRWETLPPMPTARNHIAGSTIDGKIYVAGGRFQGGFQSPATAAFEAYDPETRTWSAAAPMPTARGGINGVMADGCFHVWGGEHAGGMHANHEVYDPGTGQWLRRGDMPIPVHGVTGAAYLDGMIWVTGGGTAVGGNSGSFYNQIHQPDIRCRSSFQP